MTAAKIATPLLTGKTLLVIAPTLHFELKSANCLGSHFKLSQGEGRLRHTYGRTWYWTGCRIV